MLRWEKAPQAQRKKNKPQCNQIMQKQETIITIRKGETSARRTIKMKQTNSTCSCAPFSLQKTPMLLARTIPSNERKWYTKITWLKIVLKSNRKDNKGQSLKRSKEGQRRKEEQATDRYRTRTIWKMRSVKKVATTTTTNEEREVVTTTTK